MQQWGSVYILGHVVKRKDTMFCRYSDVLGRPGEGVHSIRIPGTPTAAVDFASTLLLAWLVSWSFSVSLSITTSTFLLLGMFFHALFCVDTLPCPALRT